MDPSSALGTDQKPSWAFDVAEGSPRSKTTVQNYRIPYPRSPLDEDTPEQKFICARAFLVFVNILFFAIGFASLVTSIAVAAKPERCELCHSVLNILLVLGIVISFIAALGIYGALLNSYKILLLYVTLVAFLFMVQIVVFFWSLLGRANFQRRMHTMFREKIRRQPHQITELLDVVQRRWPCCGVDGPLDYHSAGLQLPLSCCSSPTGGDQCAAQTREPASTTPLSTTTTNGTEESTVTSSAATEVTTIISSSSLSSKRESEMEHLQPEIAKLKQMPAVEAKTTQKVKAYGAEEKSTQTNEETTVADETMLESEEIAPEAEITTVQMETEPPPKDRHKRSFTDPADVTSEVDGVVTIPTEPTPGNITVVKINITEVLEVNITTNGTTEASLEELFSNRTNLAGGPELWDIHNVKKRGCYPELWSAAEHSSGLLVGSTLAAAALLTLQLVVLCTAHRVARGDFIQQA